MKKQIVVVAIGILIFVLLGLIGLNLVNMDAERLASSLTNRIAIVTDLDDVLIKTDYDATFLDPHDRAIQITGESWPGSTEIHQRVNPYVHLLGLTEKGSQLEVTCTEPTTTIGVQFWRDDNDGWAFIIVDDEYELERNVWNLKEYIEITDLPLRPHQIRVEAAGEPGHAGAGGGIHVTVAGISCRQLGPGLNRMQMIFLPLIINS